MAPTTRTVGTSGGEGGLDDSTRRYIDESMAASMAAFRQSMEQMMSQFLQSQSQPNTGMVERTQHQGQNGQVSVSRMTKVEFPKFSGDDVRGWMFRCEQFFAIDNIPDDQKVRLISVHLFDKALLWHRQFIRLHGELVLWNVYRDAIIQRFGSLFDDPMSEIKNVKYETNSKDYQDVFDTFLSRVDISEDRAISFYLGGLPTELEMAVRMFKPKSLADAYSLTNLQEATLNAIKKKNRFQANVNTGRFGVNNGGVNNAAKPLLPLPNANRNWNNRPQNVQPRRQLTQKEYEEKRAKNLCFYCDKKFVPGHKCEGQLYSLVVLAEDEEVEEEYEDAVGEIEEDEMQPQISLNALNGQSSYKTLRVVGLFRDKHKLHILVDSGSTHNFLDINVAKRLGCNIRQTCPLSVAVAGGRQLISVSECKGFTWMIGGETFVTDVMLLPLGGCDMVLGIQWLSTLGTIKCDFKELKMQFKYNGKKIAIRGTTKSVVQWMEGKKQLKVMHGGPQAEMFMLSVYPNTGLTLMTMEEKQDAGEEESELAQVSGGSV